MNFLKKIGIEVEKVEKVTKPKEMRITKKEKKDIVNVVEVDNTINESVSIPVIVGNDYVDSRLNEKLKKSPKKKKSKRYIRKKKESVDEYNRIGILDDNRRYQKYKSANLRKRIIGYLLSAFIIVGSARGCIASSNVINYDIYSEKMFINDYLNVYLKGEKTEIDKYSIDTNIRTTFQKDDYKVEKINSVEIINRTILETNEIHYLIKINYSLSGNSYEQAFLKFDMYQETPGSYLIYRNAEEFKPQTYSVADKTDITVPDNPKLEGTSVGTTDITKLTDQFKMFLKNYNESYDETQKAFKFKVDNYGDGKFDISSLLVEKCILNKEEYVCDSKINFENENKNRITSLYIRITFDAESNSVKKITQL